MPRAQMTEMRRIIELALLAFLLPSVALADRDHRDDLRHATPIQRRSGTEITPAVSRNALQFTGAASARAPVTATSLTSGITLEAWVRWDGGAGSQAVMYNGNSGTSGYGIYLENGRVRILAGGVDWATCTTCALAQGEWTHLAAVRTTTVWFLFQNGVLQTLDNPTLTAWAPVGRFSIASSPSGGERLVGAIDEVRVWTEARSPAEIERDFTASLTGQEPHLVHYYRLDEGRGSLITDVRGTLPVTLFGGPSWIASGVPLAIAGPAR